MTFRRRLGLLLLSGATLAACGGDDSTTTRGLERAGERKLEEARATYMKVNRALGPFLTAKTSDTIMVNAAMDIADSMEAAVREFFAIESELDSLRYHQGVERAQADPAAFRLRYAALVRRLDGTIHRFPRVGVRADELRAIYHYPEQPLPHRPSPLDSGVVSR